MKLKISGNTLTVIREKGDKKYYKRSRNSWGSEESNALYVIKNELNKKGYDLIKKRMAKDGHLVDDNQQYLRSRNMKQADPICIYDGYYAIRNMAEDLNKDGKIVLTIHHFVMGQGEKYVGKDREK